MVNQPIEKLLESLDNDVPPSAQLQKKAPALTEAFDNDRIKKTLQEMLFVADGLDIIL